MGNHLITKDSTPKLNNEEMVNQIKERKDTNSSNIKYTGGSFWEDIRLYYKFSHVLGSGKSKVRIAFNKANGKPYAVKSIHKKDLTIKDLNVVLNEIELLTTIYHPYIIKLIEAYQDKYYLHIVTEYFSGKDLYHEMMESKNTLFEEKKIKAILKRVLYALNYCHSLGIIHRDIKPENILICNTGLKLVDFGFSKRKESHEKLHTIIGTPFYIAPEVLLGDYVSKCDVWSLGVVGFVLFYGFPPFSGETNSEIYDKIINCEIKFPDNPNVSKTTKNFLKKCFEKDPSRRFSSVQAMNDRFFSEENQKETLTKEEILTLKSCLENMKNQLKNEDPDKNSELKRLIYRYLIDFGDYFREKELLHFRKIFRICDINYEGFISKENFLTILKENEIIITSEDQEYFCKFKDVDYSSFLMSNISLDSNSKDIIVKAFKYFDVNNSGSIEFIDIKNSFLRLGKHIVNDDEITRIIREASNNEKVISVQNFYQILGLNY
jgi:calcium-dependent protein kinase